MFAVMALRISVAAVFGALTYISSPSNLWLVVVLVVGVFAIDTRNILTLKNFTIVYILVVFGIGGAVLHFSPPSIFGDVAAYLVAFLAGYTFASLRSTTDTGRQGAGRESSRARRRGRLNAEAIERCLLLLIGLNLLFLALQLYKYGIVGFYRGAGLLDQALSYGTADAAGGAEQILRFGLKFSGIALVVLYVRACFESSIKIKYKYPMVVLVVLPIISLNRFDALVGALTALAIFASDGRLSERRRSVPAPAAPTRAAPAAPSSPGMTRGLAIAVGIILAATTGLFIADLRSGFGRTSGDRRTSNLSLLTSELSPVQAYADIKANINVLGHPYGRTIVLPAVFKAVPRAWYPDKPLNSGAYYMSVVRPGEFAAGFALPPTFFGDAYLSFGFGGAIALSLVLGMVTARLDLGYKLSDPRRLSWFLLAFANFYGVLRYPMSESLAGILLTLSVLWIADRVFRVPAGSDAIGQDEQRPPATPAVRLSPHR